MKSRPDHAPVTRNIYCPVCTAGNMAGKSSRIWMAGEDWRRMNHILIYI